MLALAPVFALVRPGPSSVRAPRDRNGRRPIPRSAMQCTTDEPLALRLPHQPAPQ
ncbi:hypothetical protein LC55x_1586 [Lysobacter capsici]|nr:hypothetical protein LC55x_1586 [Lysobacter capsici]